MATRPGTHGVAGHTENQTHGRETRRMSMATPTSTKPDSRRAPRTEMLSLSAAVVLALLLRMANLLSLPIFTDEAIYLRWADDIWEQSVP